MRNKLLMHLMPQHRMTITTQSPLSFDTFLKQKHSGRAGEKNSSLPFALSATQWCIEGSPRTGNKNYSFLFVLVSFQMSFGIDLPKLITHTAKQIDEHTQEIIIAFTVDKKDCLYKDFITVSAYEPTVTVSTWKANTLPVAHYDPLFKETKQIFNEDFAISITATAEHATREPRYLYCSYYRRSDKKINQTLIPLFFMPDEAPHEQCIETHIDAMTATEVNQKKNTPPHLSPIDDYYDTILSLTQTIIQSFKTDHKKYFLLFIMLIILFLILSHCLKEQLKRQIALKELTDVIISLLGLLITIYGLFYVNIIGTPLITISLACASACGAGFFYIKKSTKLQSGYLRTLCTIIGTLCICSAIFLLFKLLRYF
jgi:hypothetical protein